MKQFLTFVVISVAVSVLCFLYLVVPASPASPFADSIGLQVSPSPRIASETSTKFEFGKLVQEFRKFQRESIVFCFLFLLGLGLVGSMIGFFGSLLRLPELLQMAILGLSILGSFWMGAWLTDVPVGLLEYGPKWGFKTLFVLTGTGAYFLGVFAGVYAGSYIREFGEAVDWRRA